MRKCILTILLFTNIIYLTAEESKKVPVFIFGGQSNMQGIKAKPGKYTKLNNVFKWSHKKGGLLEINKLDYFGPDIAFANLIASKINSDKIYIVTSARGGTSLYRGWKVTENESVEKSKKAMGSQLSKFKAEVSRMMIILKKEGLTSEFKVVVTSKEFSDKVSARATKYAKKEFMVDGDHR